MTKFLKGATINDDFTDALSDVRFWVFKRQLDFAFTQEVKNTNLHRKFAGKGYFVWQARNDEAKSGVGIVVKMGPGVKILDTGIHLMSKGGGLLARYVIWVDVEFADGLRRRLVTWHRAPARARGLWKRQDAVVAAVINSSPYPVWGGTDANQDGGPDNLMAKLARKYRWRGAHIDGFIIRATDIAKGFKSWRLRVRNSDHQAYMGRFPVG